MANLRRLIDLDEIKPICFPSTEMDGLDVVRYLNTLPTVDAVEVVRCKDCKHGMKSRMQPGHAKNILCKRSWYGDYHEPDHFCSYGERKTDV